MIRRKTTKEILGESIHELAKKKPVDKITVKEIAENCGLSSGTFYHHFHDKYELIAWIYIYQMEDIFLDFCDGAENWRQTLFDIASILDRDRSFYENALKNTGGQNSFSRAIHQRTVELLMDVVKQNGNSPADEELLFDVQFYLRGVSFSIYEWFYYKQPYSVEMLADCLYRAMPEKLKPILAQEG